MKGKIVIAMAQPPFAPTVYEPKKRVRQFNLRFTEAEMDLIERVATRRQLTVSNLIRILVGEGLQREFPAKKPRR